VPATFVAVTVTVYGVPLRRFVRRSGLVVPVTLCPPGDAVARYDVIGVPPSNAGGAKVTRSWPFFDTMPTTVGAPGTVRGVTAADGAEGELGAMGFVARTVNVYGTPLESPLTVRGERAPVAVNRRVTT